MRHKSILALIFSLATTSGALANTFEATQQGQLDENTTAVKNALLQAHPEYTDEIEYFYSLSPDKRIEVLNSDQAFPAALVVAVTAAAGMTTPTTITITAATVPLMDKAMSNLETQNSSVKNVLDY